MILIGSKTEFFGKSFVLVLLLAFPTSNQLYGALKMKKSDGILFDNNKSKARTPLHMDGGLDHFFPNSILLDIAKDGFTII